MKIFAINGSPRKNGKTQWALEQTLEALKTVDSSIETELISLAGKKISGCISCGKCRNTFGCSIKDDFIEIQEKLKCPDMVGLIAGSPVYMGSMTSQMKAFWDRSVLFRRNGFFFKNKLGAALTIGGSRNGGQDLTLQNIHAAMMIHDMILLGDGYGTAHFGGAGWANVPGGMEEDATSLETFQNLGKRMAEVAHLIKS